MLSAVVLSAAVLVGSLMLRSSVDSLTDEIAEVRSGLTEAQQAFTEVLHLQPEDKLSQLYIDRCDQMRENPPADDWDGVWVMESK